MQNFFYDEQIRRFLLQFTRAFSNFYVEYGRAEDGTAALAQVPVKYGDWSRLGQTVHQNNSASSLPSAPLISVYVTGMSYDRDRLRDPNFIQKTAVRRRFYNTDTNTYESAQGNAFTIERAMPAPYRLEVTVDIWTSNTNQKWQLLEQIVPLFNPSLEIQSTDSFLDWTSLSVIELLDMTYSSRSVPVGTENPIDVASMRFSVPIWISSPARVKKLGVVEKIVAGIFDANGDASNAVLDSDLLLGTRQKFTPWMYQTLLIGNRLQLLAQSNVVNVGNQSLELPDAADTNANWEAVLGAYGNFRPGITQIRLNNAWDETLDVIGTVTVDPADSRFLIFEVDPDTIPQNTLPPVDAVIDPLLSGPGAGLPVAAVGQRYLLVNSIGSNANGIHAAAGWGGLVAETNDIIEFDGNNWTVVFHNDPDIQYVTNLTTGLQYLWDGVQWVKSYEGLYPAGSWSIVL